MYAYGLHFSILFYIIYDFVMAENSIYLDQHVRMRTSVSLFPNRCIFNYSCTYLSNRQIRLHPLERQGKHVKYKIFLKNPIQNHLQFWIQLSVLASFKQVYSISLTFLSLKFTCQRRNLERPFENLKNLQYRLLCSRLDVCRVLRHLGSGWYFGYFSATTQSISEIQQNLAPPSRDFVLYTLQHLHVT